MRKPVMILVTISLLAAACGDNSDGEPVQAPETDAGADAKADAASEKDAEVEAKAEAAPEKDVAEPEASDDAEVQTGFCDDVEEGHAAILFIPPQPRGDGFLAAAAWVHYPPYAKKPDVEWTNPYPGCVADYASDEQVLCDFGPAFQGMSVSAIFGLNDGSPTSAIPGDDYFAWTDAEGDHVVGEAYACSGKTVVGSMKNGVYGGLLKADSTNPLNMLFEVP